MSTRSARKAAAGRAREGKARKRLGISESITEVTSPLSDSEQDDEVTSWTGGVNNHVIEYGSETDSEDPDASNISGDSDSDDEVVELEGVELIHSLRNQTEHNAQMIEDATDLPVELESSLEKMMKTNITKKDWKKAEQNRGLGYTGNSDRTLSRRAKDARDKAERDEKLRKTKSAAMMRNIFLKPRVAAASLKSNSSATEISDSDVEVTTILPSVENPICEVPIFTGYVSDLDSSGSESDKDEPTPAIPTLDVSDHDESSLPDLEGPSFRVCGAPPLKRRRHEVPVRVAKKQAKDARVNEQKEALVAIRKLMASKKNIFDAGQNGLQAYRARAIQSHLQMVVENGRSKTEASERAAEANGFAAKWGGRLVRQWVRKWVLKRELPSSSRGSHVKVFSILEDPAIRAELRSFLRSNKWSIDPTKVSDFTRTTSIPAAAEKYQQELIEEEMPRGLKKYMELELFPRIGLKAGKKGVSIQTARRFLKREGFKFTEHKKSLYYDGHERPDVVEYRQKKFLPAMEGYRQRLVEYVVGDVGKEMDKPAPNYVERRLVLVAHDEMTTQQNDGKKKSWVLDGEHALKKKGQGRGMHRSDVICSTVGHMVDAGQSLEYGKNYEGYWTGEMFVTQLREKIIPTFERLHGPGYQALIMVDNSQGHSAYSKDALLVSRMNLRPGGKQARMRNGWFIQNDLKVPQEMIFPADHPEFPDQPKGMRQVLIERGLWKNDLRMACKDECASDNPSCCAKKILEAQPDFQEQRSLVQEVIEEAGHLCIFLPKFHCELNFIEFFWGAVKRWLRENCDYTFTGLQANLPQALASVDISTIRKWEHRMIRWMEAYRSGLSARDAQFEVKKFSSRKYTSHRRIPESLARRFDQ